VAIRANSQHLQINSSLLLDHPFVLFAVDLEIQRPAVRHVSVAHVDVDMIEEILLHEITVALRMLGPQADVLVEVESNHA
jgi:hypothetical protein